MTSGSFNTVGVSIAIGWIALAIVLVATVAALYVAICAQRKRAQPRDQDARTLRAPAGPCTSWRSPASSARFRPWWHRACRRKRPCARPWRPSTTPSCKAELQAAYDSMIDLENPRSLAQAIVEHEIVEPVYGRMLLMGTHAGSVDEVLGHLCAGVLRRRQHADRRRGRPGRTHAGSLPDHRRRRNLIAVMLPLIGIMGSIA